MKKILFIYILALSLLGFACDGDKSNGGIVSGTKETTAKGVNLISSNGVNNQVKSDIDIALTKVFTDSRALGYSNGLDYNFYTIIVKDDCILSPGGVLSFKIRADEYDGTEFDQNPTQGIGEVLAAEQVISNGSHLTSTYIICNASTPLVLETARYGAEHIILYNNDMNEYNRTKFHGNGVGHPIIATSLSGRAKS